MAIVRTAARAIIQRDGKLLVIRYRDAQGDFFSFPGGAQRHGESLHEAVVREVAEETGMVIRPGALRCVRECRGSDQSRSLPSDWHSVEIFFECELAGEHGEPTELDPGQAEALWLTISELRQRCFFPAALLEGLASGEPMPYLGIA